MFIFIFAVGMSIIMLGLGLSADASDSIAFAINEDGNDVNVGDFWDVVLVRRLHLSHRLAL